VDSRLGGVTDLVSLVIPVKAAPAAKSRLGGDDSLRAALAAAIALDTVEAARASATVGELIVVGTLDHALPGVRLIDDPGGGLRAAIEAGLATLDASTPRAVLLGDLPALRSLELDEALTAAREHDRALVTDAEGTGSTLIVARAAVSHTPFFGPASAARHRAAGYVDLDVALLDGLRRDVDTVEQLALAAALTLGPRTRDLLDAQ
jgi:2-phospho-L-lactate guanylyltransferase